MDSRFISAIYAIFDRDNDGYMTFDDFLAFFDACLKSEIYPTYFYQLIFDNVDHDKNGFIDESEMIAFTELCGRKLSQKQIKDELRSIDKDQSGDISFEELCAALKII